MTAVFWSAVQTVIWMKKAEKYREEERVWMRLLRQYLLGY